MSDDGLVFLTGASGFVGAGVARALRARGLAVRALVRKTSPLVHLQGLDLEIVEGDLRDRRAVEEAMRGVRFAFHVAADYRLWAPDPQAILENNLTMTQNVMQAAKDVGVERIVYTSSVAAVAPGEVGQPADETRFLSEQAAIGAYKRSKVLAERLVMEMAGQGLPVVIVNPSTPVGPCDVRPTPTGRIIVETASGRMPGYIETGLNMVHVDDVALGHLAALERGRVGERYILGGQNAPLSEILATIAWLAGKRPPAFRIPRAAVYPAAVVAEAFARRSGKEPFITRDGLKMAKRPMYFTAAKAEAELGYRARPYAEAIAEALAWFRQFGYLPAGRQ